MKVHLR